MARLEVVFVPAIVLVAPEANAQRATPHQLGRGRPVRHVCWKKFRPETRIGLMAVGTDLHSVRTKAGRLVEWITSLDSSDLGG